MNAKRVLSRGAIYIVLTLFCLFYLMPFYVMFITGLKPYEDLNVTRMWELPKRIHLDGILEAWERVAPNFFNSAIVTIPAALLSSIIGSMNGSPVVTPIESILHRVKTRARRSAVVTAWAA